MQSLMKWKTLCTNIFFKDSWIKDTVRALRSFDVYRPHGSQNECLNHWLYIDLYILYIMTCLYCTVCHYLYTQSLVWTNKWLKWNLGYMRLCLITPCVCVYHSSSVSSASVIESETSENQTAKLMFFNFFIFLFSDIKTCNMFHHRDLS